jgi:hypothetical protein
VNSLARRYLESRRRRGPGWCTPRWRSRRSCYQRLAGLRRVCGRVVAAAARSPRLSRRSARCAGPAAVRCSCRACASLSAVAARECHAPDPAQHGGRR